MRIAVMGAGGIGGYVGARLAAAGQDVVFIARGQHLAAMQSDGLRIESPFGDLHLPRVRATDDPAEAGPADFVLFTVKLYDGEAAAAAIKPLIGPDTRVLTLQNGIDSAALLSRFIRAEQVVAGAIYLSAWVKAPGTIASSGGVKHITAADGNGHPVMNEFVEACKRMEGLELRVSHNIETLLWEKFVNLSAFSGATSLMRAPIGAIRANPESWAFTTQLIDEGRAVASASGIRLAEDFQDHLMSLWGSLPYETRSSMSLDLEHGRRLELDWLSGRMHALGQSAGVPTPAHTAVCQALALHTGGRPRV